MKNDLRTLLTDIKAAARIGHEESLWMALDGLLDFPEVSGNPTMPEAFISSVALPIGEALTHPRIQIAVIRSLAKQPDAVLRAIAGASLVFRVFSSDDSSLGDLTSFSLDNRKDVRLTLQLAIAQAAETNPTLLLNLTRTWLRAKPARQQAVALGLLPTLALSDSQEALGLLADLEFLSDPDWRAALSDSLTRLAEKGNEIPALSQMHTWAKETTSSQWVICKALSRSWAAAHAPAALEILKTLVQSLGPDKQITNTLKALSRHGAEEQVKATLAEWQNGEDQDLREAADKFFEITDD